MRQMSIDSVGGGGGGGVTPLCNHMGTRRNLGYTLLITIRIFGSFWDVVHIFRIFGYVFNRLHTQIPEKVYFQDYHFRNFLFTHIFPLHQHIYAKKQFSCSFTPRIYNTNTVLYCTCVEDVYMPIETRCEFCVDERRVCTDFWPNN